MSCCSIAGDGFGGASAGIAARGVYSPPEAWVANDVAGDVAVTMSALVSTSFDTIKMIRPGSIVGLATRLSAPVTNGNLLVEILKNGAATGFLMNHTNALNTSGGVATQAVGTFTYVAGDLIGMRCTTEGFAPVGDDLEAWLQLSEAL